MVSKSSLQDRISEYTKRNQSISQRSPYHSKESDRSQNIITEASLHNSTFGNYDVERRNVFSADGMNRVGKNITPSGISDFGGRKKTLAE